MHPTTIVRTLRNAGADVRYLAMTDDDVDDARRMYESGLSLAAVGEHFGVATRTVLNAFRNAGVATRPVGTNQWLH